MSGKEQKQTTTAVASGRRVIDIEIDGLRAVAARLGRDFERAVELVAGCGGRIVVTGMGKSGQVSKKIAATLSSTGTTALFIHAAEAAHGDLGMLARGDLCLAVSNSGTTAEILTLLPAIKRLGIGIIALTGDARSPLGQAADVVLDVSVDKEACPLDLAPTASTTATLAMGDALAVAVLERRGFSAEDFARLHPGGALGQKLIRVSELMHTTVPTVQQQTPLEATLEAITTGGLGTVAVVDERGRLAGIITDGDLRRNLADPTTLISQTAEAIMTSSPHTIMESMLAAQALNLMEAERVTSLIVVDEDCLIRGVVHLH
ncbi:MAG: KpsF/GutQ family sugar-phosphate isomerase, partial [Deltaproteobacteria bacterium]